MTGKTAGGELTSGQRDTASLLIVRNPLLEVTKLADVTEVDAAGDVIKYSIALKNTGNITLTGITLSDPLTSDEAYASGDANTNGKLDVGETWLYTASYTVTQADMDAGLPIKNTEPGDSNETPPDDGTTTVTVKQTPDFTIDKLVESITGGTVDGKVDSAGDIINYKIVVDNTGNVTLTGVTVTDQVESYGVTNATLVSGDTDNDGKLDVNETWTYSASYTVTAADISGNGGGDGDIDNTATADTNETAPKSNSASVPIEVQDICYEGLTPGFWKNAQNWRKVDLDQDCLDWLAPYANANYDGKAGVSFTDIMNTVTFAEAFGVGDFSYRQSGKTFVVDADVSLVQALGLGGGVESMFRHATAALLNSCTEEHQGDEFNFFLDTTEVRLLVQDVYGVLSPTARRAAAIDLGGDLAKLNELETEGSYGYVCPDPDYLASLFPSLFPEVTVA